MLEFVRRLTNFDLKDHKDKSQDTSVQPTKRSNEQKVVELSSSDIRAHSLVRIPYFGKEICKECLIYASYIGLAGTLSGFTSVAMILLNRIVCSNNGDNESNCDTENDLIVTHTLNHHNEYIFTPRICHGNQYVKSQFQPAPISHIESIKTIFACIPASFGSCIYNALNVVFLKGNTNPVICYSNPFSKFVCKYYEAVISKDSIFPQSKLHNENILCIKSNHEQASCTDSTCSDENHIDLSRTTFTEYIKSEGNTPADESITNSISDTYITAISTAFATVAVIAYATAGYFIYIGISGQCGHFKQTKSNDDNGRKVESSTAIPLASTVVDEFGQTSVHTATASGTGTVDNDKITTGRSFLTSITGHSENSAVDIELGQKMRMNDNQQYGRKDQKFVDLSQKTRSPTV